MIRNLTPDTVVVFAEDPAGEIEGTTGTDPQAQFIRYRKVAEIAPAGPVARATQREETVGSVPVNGADIPVVLVYYGPTIGLPEPQDGTMYFISVLTAQAAAAQGRRTDDLLFSGKSVRGQDGRIIGILSFAQLEGKERGHSCAGRRMTKSRTGPATCPMAVVSWEGSASTRIPPFLIRVHQINWWIQRR